MTAGDSVGSWVGEVLYIRPAVEAKCQRLGRERCFAVRTHDEDNNQLVRCGGRRLCGSGNLISELSLSIRKPPENDNHWEGCLF